MPEPLTIMVAPNGARRTKDDHSAIPVTAADTAKVLSACAEAGASAAHVHVRDGDGRHLLDADAYSSMLHAVSRALPDEFVCQITTEAVGRYSPPEQRAVVQAVRPDAVSIAIKEMVPDAGAETEAAEFYEWCRREEVAVQHILYEASEVDRLIDLARRGIIPTERLSALFVFGRYSTDQQSDANMLRPFLDKLDAVPDAPDVTWMMCAFGLGETASAAAAMAMGGHVRVGFENSLWRPDGSVSQDNSETVARSSRIAHELGRRPTRRAETLAVLGAPKGA